ncbi:hypothetical protein BC939DRAFT_507303 [Gamsiella multidivaricata]|uniref:uncharacterized protein n=1 Tax=Gamsiella multidivaricata TaxID=101098 RepID=UPI002220C509|nr:uncharacterized protein BC939DRAFT_507303 [Gamsiella multidivaricata]KAG0357681.1 hypothetical protein BGZ54_000233 [Gamsiella multidivaricata]KAI7817597.1 hypothetical protein BC939DRAFT_507303 [Gamsiella multidivaricata]
MSICPLCTGPVAKFILSFNVEFEMCSNMDCVYPFQDDKICEASLVDKRPLKRKPLSSGTESMKQSVSKKLKAVGPTPGTKALDGLVPEKGAITDLAARVSTRATLIEALPALTSISSSTNPTVSTSFATDATTSASSVIPGVSSIPVVVATTSTGIMKPLASTISPTSMSSIPSSPAEGVPDLIFDMFPTASWTTPVTPPDNLLSSSIDMSKSITSAIDTSAVNIESLLFGDQFEIDFSGLEGLVNSAVEFDADFEAMLQQQL